MKLLHSLRLLPFLFGVLACGTAFASSGAPSEVYVRFTNPRIASATAHRVLAPFGSVVRRDVRRRAYVVKVTNRNPIAKTIQQIKAVRGVASVDADAKGVVRQGFARNSLASVDLFIASAKRLHPKEREEHEKPGQEDEQEGAHLDFLEAYRHYIHDRAYPNDSVNWNAYAAAIAHRDAMPVGSIGNQTRSLDPAAQWTFVGPKNLDVPYTTYYGVRPINGRVNAIAYDPTNPLIVYIAGATGGIMKSTDGGSTWKAVGDGLPSLMVSSIAIDPLAHNTVYIGGGDFHGFGGYSFGLMKSVDAGGHWAPLPLPAATSLPVTDILVDPDNSSIITVTTGGGNNIPVPGSGYTNWTGAIYRSADAGASWIRVSTLPYYFTSLDYGPKETTGGRTYYASTGGWFSSASYPEVVLKSTNRGSSWTVVNRPYGATTNLAYASFVAASKVTPGVVYWLVPRLQTIFRSSNSGGSWTNVTNDYPKGDYDSRTGIYYNFSQWYYNFSLETAAVTINGTKKDLVLCGNIDPAYSVDGGSHWTSIGGPTYANWATVHNDQHAFAVNPKNPNESLIGCDGGLYRFTYAPASNTFTTAPLSKQLGITEFYTGDWHPTKASIMIGGSQDNATPVSLGDINNWANVAGGDGAGCAIDQSTPSFQYASWQYYGVFMTRDSWASAMSIDLPYSGVDNVPFIGKLWMDPNNSKILYGGTNYLYRFTAATSGSSGGTWTSRIGGKVLATGNSTIASVAVAKGDSQTIYVGSDEANLWKTSDGGTTWTDIRSNTLPILPVLDLYVNPSNKADVIITLGGIGSGFGHVWRCTNTSAATKVWTNISGTGATSLPDVPVHTIERAPYQTATYYVGTDLGVFMTSDAGLNWANASFPLGLPNVQVNELKAVPGTGYLNAATFGRGMWRIKLANVTTPALSVLELDPMTVKAGATAQGTVLLSQAATKATTVNLTATTGAALSATSVTIPAGSTAGLFTVRGLPTVQADTDVTVTATSSNTKSAMLRVVATKNSGFVSQTVPTSATVGQTFPVTVTFKNLGSITWSTDKRYVLAVTSAGWGVSTVPMLSGETVAYGKQRTFTFNVTAPSTPGTYKLQFRMKVGAYLFGATPAAALVTVQ